LDTHKITSLSFCVAIANTQLTMFSRLCLVNLSISKKSAY
jgi:hypothetical protein